MKDNGHTPDCNPGNCDISGEEFTRRHRPRVTWRGKVGMWLLDHDLPMTYWVWSKFCKYWDKYQEVRFKEPDLWP